MVEEARRRPGRRGEDGRRSGDREMARLKENREKEAAVAGSAAAMEATVFFLRSACERKEMERDPPLNIGAQGPPGPT
jgi:hypothetical protein